MLETLRNQRLETPFPFTMVIDLSPRTSLYVKMSTQTSCPSSGLTRKINHSLQSLRERKSHSHKTIQRIMNKIKLIFGLLEHNEVNIPMGRAKPRIYVCFRINQRNSRELHYCTYTFNQTSQRKDLCFLAEGFVSWQKDSFLGGRVRFLIVSGPKPVEAVRYLNHNFRIYSCFSF
jgi:hypothetical protein